MSRDATDGRTIDLFSHTDAVGANACRATVSSFRPVARSTDPETSLAAAELATLRASRNQILVLRTLVKEGPLTDFELAERTGIQQTSIGKRRGECVKAGLVAATFCAETGRSYTRPAPSGAAAIVWRLTDAGFAFLRDLQEGK